MRLQVQQNYRQIIFLHSIEQVHFVKTAACQKPAKLLNLHQTHTFLDQQT